MPFVPTCVTCLRALCAYAPYVPTCLRASNYYVPMCLRALNYYVPTCLRALNYYVPTCLRAYAPTWLKLLRAYVPTRQRTFIYIFHAYVPSCLKLFRVYVHSFSTCLNASNHSQNILSITSIPCIAVFLWIIWSFIPYKTPKQTPASKTSILKLQTLILSCGILLFQLVHVQKQ